MLECRGALHMLTSLPVDSRECHRNTISKRNSPASLTLHYTWCGGQFQRWAPDPATAGESIQGCRVSAGYFKFTLRTSRSLILHFLYSAWVWPLVFPCWYGFSLFTFGQSCTWDCRVYGPFVALSFVVVVCGQRICFVNPFKNQKFGCYFLSARVKERRMSRYSTLLVWTACLSFSSTSFVLSPWT